MKHVVQYLKQFQSAVGKNRFKTNLNIAMVNINTSWLIMIINLKTANNTSVAFSGHPVHGVQAIQVAHSPHLFMNIQYNRWLFCQPGNLGYSLPTPFREYMLMFCHPTPFLECTKKYVVFFVFVE